MFVRRRRKRFHTPFVYWNDVGELYFTKSIPGHRIWPVLAQRRRVCVVKNLFFTLVAVVDGSLWDVTVFRSTTTVDGWHRRGETSIIQVTVGGLAPGIVSEETFSARVGGTTRVKIYIFFFRIVFLVQRVWTRGWRRDGNSCTLVMDEPTKGIQDLAPWHVAYANDVICLKDENTKFW